MAGENCGDNRFKLIAKAKEELITNTNIESSPEEMAVLDNILFRMWQMGWLPTNPWHKVSEELPKMAHFTADGDYSDLCVCINESGEHKILVLCEQGDCTYWAYGYDGEDLYDEEMDGEITHWMPIPELPKED